MTSWASRRRHFDIPDPTLPKQWRPSRRLQPSSEKSQAASGSQRFSFHKVGTCVTDVTLKLLISHHYFQEHINKKHLQMIVRGAGFHIGLTPLKGTFSFIRFLNIFVPNNFTISLQSSISSPASITTVKFCLVPPLGYTGYRVLGDLYVMSCHTDGCRQNKGKPRIRNCV